MNEPPMAAGATGPEGTTNVAVESARKVLTLDPFEKVTNAVNELAKAAESSASTFLMGFGAVLVIIAVLTQVRFEDYQLERLSTGEFVALLLSGVFVLLVGGGVRMYLGVIQARAESTHLEWVQAQAGKLLDTQSARADDLLGTALGVPGDGPKPGPKPINP